MYRCKSVSPVHSVLTDPWLQLLPRIGQTLKLSYVTFYISTPIWRYIQKLKKDNKIDIMVELFLTNVQKMPHSQAWAGPWGFTLRRDESVSDSEPAG